MLAASENNFISDDHPNQYLPALVESLGSDAVSVFRSNYLPDPENIDYSKLEYLKFLALRAELILRDINMLADGKTI